MHTLKGFLIKLFLKRSTCRSRWSGKQRGNYKFLINRINLLNKWHLRANQFDSLIAHHRLQSVQKCNHCKDVERTLGVISALSARQMEKVTESAEGKPKRKKAKPKALITLHFLCRNTIMAKIKQLNIHEPSITPIENRNKVSVK